MDVAAWQLEEAGQRDRPAAQWVGHDPAVLANALKRLRSQMGDVSRAMRMHERYVPPGERRRLKSARARARVRRGALRFARWEVRQEARGL
jgi:ribosomal protein S21